MSENQKVKEVWFRADYGPGAQVTVGGEISARVDFVQFSAGDRARYNCSWWHGGDKKSDWFDPDELDG